MTSSTYFFRRRASASRVHGLLLGAAALFAALGVVVPDANSSPGPPETAVGISAGSGHSCLVSTAGRARCWGASNGGAMGDGLRRGNDLVASHMALSLSTVKNVNDAVDAEIGGDQACVLRINGNVSCWGRNPAGVVDPIGKLKPTNDPFWASTVLEPIVGAPVVRGAKQISLDSGSAAWDGAAHACAVLDGGKVTCWGSDLGGQLGGASYCVTVDNGGCWHPPIGPVVVANLDHATEVAAGSGFSCARNSSGEVSCWGFDGTYRSPTVVSGLPPAKGVAAGRSSACSVVTNGAVYCWGKDLVAHYSGLSNAVSVSVGATHSCGVLISGKVSCWGSNASGEIGVGVAGDEVKTPTEVVGVTRALKVSAGLDHTCALMQGGGVKCWGGNRTGQLGDGSTRDSSFAVSVHGFGVDESGLYVAPVFPPSLKVKPLANGFTNAKSVTFSYGAAAAGESVYCSKDGAPAAICATGFVVRSSTSGETHSVTFWTISPASVSDPLRFDWTYDGVPPVLRTSAIGGLVRTKTTSKYYLQVSDDVAGVGSVEYSTAARPPSLTAKPVARQVVAYAEPVVFNTRVRVRWIRLSDKAGNWSRWYIG